MEIFEELEKLWPNRYKNIKYKIYLGKYIVEYNPYDNKEEKEAIALQHTYISEFSKTGSQEAAYKKLEKHIKTITW